MEFSCGKWRQEVCHRFLVVSSIFCLTVQLNCFAFVFVSSLVQCCAQLSSSSCSVIPIPCSVNFSFVFCLFFFFRFWFCFSYFHNQASNHILAWQPPNWWQSWRKATDWKSLLDARMQCKISILLYVRSFIFSSTYFMYLMSYLSICLTMWLLSTLEAEKKTQYDDIWVGASYLKKIKLCPKKISRSYHCFPLVIFSLIIPFKRNLFPIIFIIFLYIELILLIIYMKKFLHFDWWRAVQFFSKTVQKRGNSVQKEETNQAFWLVNYQRNLQMANQIFCFQIKRTPWMAQLMA